jgi:DNA-directed RNA polymerase specialized sigma24 family protein
MSETGSVSQWIARLKTGEEAAAQSLWEGYFRKLVERARQKLAGIPRRAADEEDVALSAFDSFCRGAARGRFPRLDDRDNLWQLLILIADRKVIDLLHHERCTRRGGGRVFAETDLSTDGEQSGATVLANLAGREPAPELVAQLTEECQRLLDRLGTSEMRSIALWKMEGYTVEEIAQRLDCAPRTVERKLQRIRTLWSEEVPS